MTHPIFEARHLNQTIQIVLAWIHCIPCIHIYIYIYLYVPNPIMHVPWLQEMVWPAKCIVYIHIYIYIYVLHVYIYIYYMYINVYILHVCIYIYIYICVCVSLRLPCLDPPFMRGSRHQGISPFYSDILSFRQEQGAWSRVPRRSGSRSPEG